MSSYPEPDSDTTLVEPGGSISIPPNFLLGRLVVQAHPDIFGSVVQWLYMNNVVGRDGKRPACWYLLDLWIHAAQFQIPALQNATLRELDRARCEEGGLPSHELQYVYQHTRKSSLLRRYVIDTWHNRPLDLQDEYPRELLLELVSTIKVRRRNNRKLLSEEQLQKYFVSEDCEDGVSASGESRDGFLADSTGESDDELPLQKSTKSTQGKLPLPPNNAREVPVTDSNLFIKKMERTFEDLENRRKTFQLEEVSIKSSAHVANSVRNLELMIRIKLYASGQATVQPLQVSDTFLRLHASIKTTLIKSQIFTFSLSSTNFPDGTSDTKLSNKIIIEDHAHQNTKASEGQDFEGFLLEPQDTVTIYVRAKESMSFQKYIIHKNFICYYSGYFDATFNSSIKEEEETQEVWLEDTSPSDVFGVFVNWMYTQKLITSEGSPLFMFWSYVALWTFAETRIIPMLQNQALRELDPLRAKYGTCQPWAYRFAYKNTKKGSPLRRYLVDTWDNRKIKYTDDYPQELLLDIVNSIESRGVKQRGRLSEAELAKYFVDEEPVRAIGIKSATDITNSPANKTTLPDSSSSSKRRRDDTTTEGSESKSNNISCNKTI
ncbi:hypothetical protein LOCC1_G003357 [Lachnellula occidentalis]|uniref:BTB domain-containing protein n=1 Tax=Lachnellula occidentalis TaxID=215460 RepID=A0A8H8UGS8_9HELO|nr:hypothetical protein LOCC1_G003357 [Lachnellula occidentalis]